jgi:hypothetical protein
MQQRQADRGDFPSHENPKVVGLLGYYIYPGSCMENVMRRNFAT